MRRRAQIVAATLVFAVFGAPVFAQPPSSRPAEAGEEADEGSGGPASGEGLALILAGEEEAPAQEQATEVAPERRPMPNYRGRDAAPDSFGRRLLWVPRLLLFPAWVVANWGLRQPLGAIARAAEGSADPLRFFVYGKNGQAMLIPTAVIDFGSRPSVGFYFRWNDVGHENHRLRARLGFWGPDWIRGVLASRWETDEWRFQLRGEAERSANGRYHGVGASGSRREGRFSYRHLDASLSFEGFLWRASRVRVYSRVRNFAFEDGGFSGRTLQSLIDDGTFDALPTGFDGYSMYALGGSATFNSRRRRPHNTSGALLQVHGEHAFDLNGPERRRWVRYGGAAQLFWDVLGSGRVITLAASGRVVQPLAGEVPFTELIELGGRGPLRGFRTGRLRGESAASLLLQYSWPVWAYLDAMIHIAIGNVFDGRFENFSLKNLRMSWGIGLGAIHSRDHRFDFGLAWGTETFEEGTQVSSVRLVLGVTSEL